MSFRNKRRYSDGQRSSIGEDQVRNAIAHIDNAMQKHICSLTPPFTMHEATQMLFKDEDIGLLLQAEKLVYSATKSATYTLGPVVDCDIQMYFKEHPAPANRAKFWQGGRADKFLEIVKVIEESRKTFGLVKFVLRWLNENATPGAIRALWPSVLVLCKGASAFKDLTSAPVRYTAPPNVGPMLQLFRETSNTVALMSMMPPDMKQRPRGYFYLTFAGSKYKHEDSGIEVDLDYIQVGLDDKSQ